MSLRGTVTRCGSRGTRPFERWSIDLYQTGLTFRRGDSLSVAVFPDLVFKIEDFLG